MDSKENTHYKRNGQTYTRNQLESRYGDKTDQIIHEYNFSFVEGDDEKISAKKNASYKRNGQTYTRNQLEIKYGDKTDKIISKYGFQREEENRESYDNKGYQGDYSETQAGKEQDKKAEPSKKKENEQGKSGQESAQPVSGSSLSGDKEPTSSDSGLSEDDKENVDNSEVGKGEDLWNRLKSGTTTLGSNLAGLKNTMSKYMASVYFAFDEEAGKKINSYSPEVREILINNMFGGTPSQQAMGLMGIELQNELKELAEKQKERTIQHEGNITDDIGNGNYSQAAYRTLQGGVESAPSMLLAAMPGGLALVGSSAASGKQESLEDEGENIGVRTALNSTINGVAEGLFERYTQGMLRGAMKGLRGNPVKAGKFSKNLVLKILKDIGGEGGTEALTSVTQNLSDKLVQGRDISGLQIMKNVADAAIIGGAMGGSVGSLNAPAYIAGRTMSKKSRKAIEDKTLQATAIEEEAKLPNVPEELKIVLNNKSKKLQDEVKSLQENEMQRVEGMSDQQIQSYFEGSNRMDDLLDEKMKIESAVREGYLNEDVGRAMLEDIDAENDRVLDEVIKSARTEFDKLDPEAKKEYLDKAERTLDFRKRRNRVENGSTVAAIDGVAQSAESVVATIGGTLTRNKTGLLDSDIEREARRLFSSDLSRDAANKKTAEYQEKQKEAEQQEEKQRADNEADNKNDADSDNESDNVGADLDGDSTQQQEQQVDDAQQQDQKQEEPDTKQDSKKEQEEDVELEEDLFEDDEIIEDPEQDAELDKEIERNKKEQNSEDASVKEEDVPDDLDEEMNRAFEEEAEAKQEEPTEDSTPDAFETKTYDTKNRDYQVKKNEDGMLDLFTAKGRKVNRNAQTKTKQIDEYVDNTNFDEGRKADNIPDSADPSTYIADNSQNPKEVAGAIQDADSSQKLDPVTEAIAEEVISGGVNKSSLAESEGAERANDASSSFFSESGKALSDIARIVEEKVFGDYNANDTRVTTEQVADFLMNNKGSRDYLDSANENPSKQALQEKFTELTGLPATDKYVEKVSGKQESTQQKDTDKTNEVEDAKESDEEIPFQQTSKDFEPISESSFKKLTDRLKRAFPNVNIVTDVNSFNERANEIEGSEIKNSDGEVYGFVDKDGTVYINPEKLNANTPVHEFAHVWINHIEKTNKALFDQGMKLMQGADGKKYMDYVESNPAYANLSKRQKEKEALAAAIGDKGEALLSEESKNSFRKFLRKLKAILKSKFFKDRADNIEGLSYEQFVDGSLEDLLGGSDLGIEQVTDNSVQMQEGSSQDSDGTLNDKVFGNSKELKMLDTANKHLNSLKKKYKKRKEDAKVTKDRREKIKNDLTRRLSEYLDSDTVDSISGGEIKRLVSAVANANSAADFDKALEKFSKIAFDAQTRGIRNEMMSNAEVFAKKDSDNAKATRERDISKALLAQAREFLSTKGVKENLSVSEIIRIGKTISEANTAKKKEAAFNDFEDMLTKARMKWTKKQLNIQDKKLKDWQIKEAKEAIQAELKTFEDNFFKEELTKENSKFLRKHEVKRIHKRLKNAKTDRTLERAIKDMNELIYDLETRKVSSQITKVLKAPLSKLESGRRKPILAEKDAKTINGVKSILNSFAANRKNKENKAELDLDFLEGLKDRNEELINKANDNGLTDKESQELSASILAANIIEARSTKDKKAKFDLLTEARDGLVNTYEQGRESYADWLQRRKDELDAAKDELIDAANRGDKRTSQLSSELMNSKTGVRASIVKGFYNSMLGRGMGDLQTLFRKIDKSSQSHMHSGSWMSLYRDIIRSSTNKTSGIMEKNRRVKEAQAEIFGTTKSIGGRKRGSQKAMSRILGKVHELNVGEVLDKDGGVQREARKVQYSESQLLNLVMHYKNEDLHPSFEAAGFNSEFMQQVDGLLNSKTKDYGDFLFDFYDDYYGEVNETYKRMYGHSLGRPEFYAGKLSRETGGLEDDFFESGMIARTAAGGSTKERTNSKDAIMAVDVNASLAQYISEMEHYKSFADIHRVYDSLLRDKTFKSVVMDNNKALNTSTGGKPNNLLIQNLGTYLEHDIARNSIEDGKSKVMNFIMSNIVRSTLAVKPKIMFNQLLSVTNSIPYLANGKHAMAAYKNWGTYYKDAKMLLKESDYVKNRWNSEDISQLTTGLDTATSSSLNISKVDKNKSSKAAQEGKLLYGQAKRGLNFGLSKLMTNVKLGDMGGVIGVVPVYSSWKSKLLSEGKTEKEAHSEAMNRFESAIELSQQAQTGFGKSALQKKAIGKLFTMYVTSPLQNYRNTASSLMEIKRGLFGKDMKGSYSRHLLSVLNFGFAQPLMYTFLANRLSGGLGWLFSEDEDDEPTEADKSMLTAAILGNFGSVPFIGSFATLVLETAVYGSIEGIGSKDFTFGGVLPNPVSDEGYRLKQDIERFGNAETKEDKMEYFAKIASHLDKMLTALPSATIQEYYGLTKAQLLGDEEYYNSEEQSGVNFSDYSPQDKLWLFMGYSKNNLEFDIKDRKSLKKIRKTILLE